MPFANIAQRISCIPQRTAPIKGEHDPAFRAEFGDREERASIQWDDKHMDALPIYQPYPRARQECSEQQWRSL
jgi:hypothetical protein